MDHKALLHHFMVYIHNTDGIKTRLIAADSLEGNRLFSPLFLTAENNMLIPGLESCSCCVHGGLFKARNNNTVVMYKISN